MRILDILENDDNFKTYDFIYDFKNSTYYNLLKDTRARLNTKILFKSHIHGQGHIERVIFFVHLLGFHYKLDKDDMDILRNAASLHDTQRQSDGMDLGHGMRAALDSISYAYVKEADKNILQAVIAAHVPNDEHMDEIIKKFIKKDDDFDRIKKLCKFFKDADGLDRVRINHLDPAYLRNDFSKELVDFAYHLYEIY